VSTAGFSWAFLVTALVMVPALLLARRETDAEPEHSLTRDAAVSVMAAA